MSFDGYDSSYSDWKESKTKALIKGGNKHEKQKYSQKFCEKWMKLFEPWLTRCADDPTKPFCRACQCRLDSNRCHLKRHERTTKHAKNLEILISKGEGAAKQNLSIRQERSKYYQQRRKMNESLNSISQEMTFDAAEDYIEETDGGDTFFHFVETEPNNSDQIMEEHDMKIETNSNDGMGPTQLNFKNIIQDNHRTPQKTGVKKERMKLLMQIQKDKNDLMQSFKDLMGTAIQQTPSKERNHVDLFFESVSSSVKALSPKLAAEAKMRVSQLICELELRALTESEMKNTNNSLNATTSVIVPTDEHNTATSSYIISTPTVIRTTQAERPDNESQQFEALS